MIFSNKYGIYELPHNSQNDWRLRKNLGSYEIRKNERENLKTSLNCNLILSLPPEMKPLLILAKNSWKVETELFPYSPISHEN